MSVTKAASSSSYEQGGSSSASSRMRNASSNLPFSDFDNKQKLEEESDEDMFTVPDVEDPPPQAAANSSKNKEPQHANSSCSITKSRRGRNPVDREYRKLKRLLRNRVSAQEARERKKVYVSDMESRANDLSHRNFELQDKVSTLINENTMMRKQVLANTRPKVDESSAPA